MATPVEPSTVDAKQAKSSDTLIKLTVPTSNPSQLIDGLRHTTSGFFQSLIAPCILRHVFGDYVVKTRLSSLTRNRITDITLSGRPTVKSDEYVGGVVTDMQWSERSSVWFDGYVGGVVRSYRAYGTRSSTRRRCIVRFGMI